MKDLRADLIRYFDSAFPKVQQDRWPFTIEDLADGIMATIGTYFARETPPYHTEAFGPSPDTAYLEGHDHDWSATVEYWEGRIEEIDRCGVCGASRPTVVRRP